MLIRLSLIVAIIAGLAVGALNFTKIKDTITQLRTDLATQTTRADTAERSLAKTTKDLEKTTATLAETTKNLETATAARAAAEADAAEKVKLAQQLTESLRNTQSLLNDAQAELAAYKSSGLTPAQALNAAKNIKFLEDTIEVANEEKKLLTRKLAKATYQLEKYTGKNPPVYLPANLNGKVLVSDPKWDFVVLNIGLEQGMKEDGELLVSRNGQLVAKVKVSNIQPDRSIANVVPGWKLGEVQEGDLVIPANPET